MEEEDRYRRRGERRGSPDERDDRRRRYSPDRNRRNGKNFTFFETSIAYDCA